MFVCRLLRETEGSGWVPGDDTLRGWKGENQKEEGRIPISPLSFHMWLQELIHRGAREALGAVGTGADPTQCLAGVPARGGALGTPAQPATELPSTKSCQCLVIIMQTQLAALLLPFRGRWVRLLSEFLPSWPTTTRSCLYGSPSPCAFLMNLRLMLDFSVSCLITAAVTSSLVGLK